MNRHRIEVAIAHLRSIPAQMAEERVDMSTHFWAMGKTSIRAVLDGCGTTACAGGFLCFVPEFAETGLRLSRGGRYPVFAGHHGYGALAELFRIGQFDALEIFGAHVDPRTGKAALDAVCAKLEALL